MLVGVTVLSVMLLQHVRRLDKALQETGSDRDVGQTEHRWQPYLVLSPLSIGPIRVCVSSAVVQPGQIFEGIRGQLSSRDAQFMPQLPHRCTLQVHSQLIDIAPLTACQVRISDHC